MNVYAAIDQLVHKAVSLQMIQAEDQTYARNQIMSLLGLTDFPEQQETGLKQIQDQDIPDLLDELVLFAVHEGLVENLLDEKDFTERPF